MNFITNLPEYEKELIEVINLFYPFENLNKKENLNISHTISIKEENVLENICIIKEEKTISTSRIDKIEFKNELERKKLVKRYAKICIYEALLKYTGKELPWGCLTGVRPTKVAYDLLESGVPQYLLKETFMKIFYVSEKKANIIIKIIKNQKCIIKNENLVDIYVNIPICPSRCLYCSSISHEASHIKHLISDYVKTLIYEIKYMKKIINNKSLVVRTIYVGGGTPSVLSADQLNEILSELSYPVNEFTVECGRPDTITKEKLQVLKNNNVTRICINPQTFNDKTLKIIGRNHTAKDIIEAYKLALNYDFDINMDLIAGLPNENFIHFKKSIDTIMELSPTNITVHTLTIKNGSIFKLEKPVLTLEKEINKMIDYAYSSLTNSDYQPYYIYRQKSMLGCLENIGFQKPGKTCIFNVDSMEETCSVIAFGADAISKRVFHLENYIKRHANVKLIEDYISRIDEMCEKKKKLFS